MVSIPYRLATNKSQQSNIDKSTKVSIPYRLATNLLQMKETMGIQQRFQSLIGQLQIRVSRAIQTNRQKFQSLIGQLQIGTNVKYSPYVELFQSLIGQLQISYIYDWTSNCFIVSIPYRLATNCYRWRKQWVCSRSFNPLQVSYK